MSAQDPTARYDWPRVTAVPTGAGEDPVSDEPLKGQIQIDVNDVRNLQIGSMSFVSFRGVTDAEQVEWMLRIQKEWGYEIIQPTAADITDLMAQKLVEAHLKTSHDLLVVPASDLMNERPLRAVGE